MEFFDYLEDEVCRNEIADKLGIKNIDKEIRYCRGLLLDMGPEYVAVKCRVLLEASLKSLLSKYMTQDELDISLNELIDKAVRIANNCAHEGENSPLLFLQRHELGALCHEIRMNGNNAAHDNGQAIKIDAAIESLTHLDTYLRSFLSGDLGDFKYKDGEPPSDQMYKNDFQQLFTDLSEKMDNIKELDFDEEAATSTFDCVKNLVGALIGFLEQNIRKAQLNSGGQNQKTKEGCPDNANDMEYESLAGLYECVSDRILQLGERMGELRDGMGTILQENEFIRKLLKDEDSNSTPEQIKVMQFHPRRSRGAKILQVKGGPGTGKTLCMLAKLIKETRGSKNALFVCFNKPLKSYVRDLLSELDPEKRITVINYDQLVSGLAKYSGSRFSAEAEDFKTFNPNNRYDKGFSQYYPDFKDPSSSEKMSRRKKLTDDRNRLIEARKKALDAGNWSSISKTKYEYLLTSEESADLKWLYDEIYWIEERFGLYSDDDVLNEYKSSKRFGRGGKRRPSAPARELICAIRKEYYDILRENKKYTIPQATNKLLGSTELPQFDFIAIDEAQDLSASSVRLLLKLRRDKDSIGIIAADEGQRIYERDFTWSKVSEPGETIRTATITLTKNKRNPSPIIHFSEMIKGIKCSKSIAEEGIIVEPKNARAINAFIRKKCSECDNQTIALISNKTSFWNNKLKTRKSLGCKLYVDASDGINEPGLYLIGPRTAKGLEFDTVIIDYDDAASDDYETEKRIRYVNFTRARKELVVLYNPKEPPRLLKECYSDYLPKPTARNAN